MPDERETFMFSATFPKSIRELSSQFMKNSIFVSIGRVGSTNEFISQHVLETTEDDKPNKLIGFVRENANEKMLIFVEMKRTANIIDRLLN
jgi:ATP-dependent RNA helicase DDX3X